MFCISQCQRLVSLKRISVEVIHFKDKLMKSVFHWGKKEILAQRWPWKYLVTFVNTWQTNFDILKVFSVFFFYIYIILRRKNLKFDRSLAPGMRRNPWDKFKMFRIKRLRLSKKSLTYHFLVLVVYLLVGFMVFTIGIEHWWIDKHRLSLIQQEPIECLPCNRTQLHWTPRGIIKNSKNIRKIVHTERILVYESAHRRIPYWWS